MARLPQPGSDDGTWGDILNSYLSQAHTSSGLLKENSVTSNTIAPNSITNASIASDAVNATSIADGTIVNNLLADGAVGETKLSSAVQTKLNAPANISDGSVTKSKLEASVQTSLEKADSALQSAPVESVVGKTGAVTLSRNDVGLSNVDNTNDASKPVSDATQAALNTKVNSSSLATVATSGSYDDLINKPTIPTVPDATTTNKGIIQLTGDLAGTSASPTVPGLVDKEPRVSSGTTSQYYRGDKSWQTLDKAAIGLSNVDNTSDASKNSANATLTNKSISGTNNTITNVPLGSAVSGTLPVANGGTGSTTQNFVDLSTTQTIAGSKTFTNILTTGDSLYVGNNPSQRISIGGGPASHGIEIGRTDNTSSTPYIDFHSGSTAVDYDTRLIASGGNGTVGQGTLTATANQFVVNGQLTRNTDIVGSSTYSANTSLATNAKSISLLNSSAGSFTMTLPSTTTAGIIFTFKKIDPSTISAYVSPPAGGNIDGNTGSTALTLVRQYDYVTVMSTTTDGQWSIIGGNIVSTGLALTDGGTIGRAPLHTISAELVDQFVHMPNLFNDIMWNRQRGGTTLVTKNGVDLGGGSIDQYYMPDSTFYSFGNLVSTDVIQLTVNLCRTFQYGTTWGIAFTGPSWQPSTAPTIEVWKDDVAAWQTLSPKKYAQGNLYMAVSGWSVTVSKLRITISGPFPVTNTVRVCSIFAVSYQSDLLSAGYLPRGGGQVYGKTGLATATAPATALVRIGDDTTSNTGGLQFGSDTFLYRQGANQLRTPGEFLISGRTQMLGAVVYNPVVDTAASVTLSTSTVPIHYANAAGGAMTYTLPSISTPGYVVTVKKIDNSANTVTILGTIDGATNYVLSSQYQTANLISTGTSGVWYLTSVSGSGGSGSYVDLTTAQTIGGVKSFTSAPKLTSSSTVGQVWTATGIDGSGGWAPFVVEKGSWTANTSYSVGNVVTAVGRRWQCVVAHTSANLWDASNWLLTGQVSNEYSLLPAGTLVPSEHIRMGSPTYGQYTASQNAAAGIRFGIGRTCTITTVAFETTTATTTPTIDVQLYTLNRATNSVSSPAILLGTISAATLGTAGIKTLSGLNISANAGDDLIIALCARGTTGPIIKSNTAVDPAYFTIGQVYGQTGWNGTNSVSGPTIGAVPLILLQAS